MTSYSQKIKKSSKFKTFLNSLICVRKNLEVTIITENIGDTNRKSEEVNDLKHYPESLLHLCDTLIKTNQPENETISKSVYTQTFDIYDEIQNLMNTPSPDLESGIVLKEHISYFGDHKTTFKIKEFKDIVSNAINPIIVEYFSINGKLNRDIANNLEDFPSIERSLMIFERITEIVNKMNTLMNQGDVSDKIREYQDFFKDGKKKSSKITDKKTKEKNKDLAKVKEMFAIKDSFFDTDLKKCCTFSEISQQCFCLNCFNMNSKIRSSNGEMLNFENIPYKTKEDFVFFVCQIIYNYVIKEQPDLEYNKLDEEISVEKSKARASNFCKFYKHINESKIKINKIIPE